jgi:hypothetical protein
MNNKNEIYFGGANKSQAFNSMQDLINIIKRFNNEAQTLIQKQTIPNLVKRPDKIGTKKLNKNYSTNIDTVKNLYERFIVGIIRGATKTKLLKASHINYDKNIIEFIKLLNTRLYYIRQLYKNTDKIYCIRLRNLLGGSNTQGQEPITSENKSIINPVINEFNKRFSTIAGTKYNTILTEKRTDELIIDGVSIIQSYKYKVKYNKSNISISLFNKSDILYTVKKNSANKWMLFDTNGKEIILNANNDCTSKNLSKSSLATQSIIGVKDTDKITSKKATLDILGIKKPDILKTDVTKGKVAKMGKLLISGDKKSRTIVGTPPPDDTDIIPASTTDTTVDNPTSTVTKSILKKTPQKQIETSQSNGNRTINIAITIPSNFNVDNTDNGNNSFSTSIDMLQNHIKSSGVTFKE